MKSMSYDADFSLFDPFLARQGLSIGLQEYWYASAKAVFFGIGPQNTVIAVPPSFSRGRCQEGQKYLFFRKNTEIAVFGCKRKNPFKSVTYAKTRDS